MPSILPAIIIHPMRRFLWILLVFVLSSLACQTVMGRLYPQLPEALVQPTVTLQPDSDAAPTSTTLADSSTPTLAAGTDEQDAPATPSPLPTDPSESAASRVQFADRMEVRFHPDGPLYAGDQVSLEVIPDESIPVDGREVELWVSESQEKTESRLLGKAPFGRYGIGGRTQATFTWIWDTTGLLPGEYDLEFTLLPEGQTWTATTTLLPASLVPSPEPQARWEKVDGDCCTWWFISGTEAERDLEQLLDSSEELAKTAAGLLGTDFEEKIPITFLPRVLGHGGFAGEDISVSYLDRDYAGGDPEIVILHEMVHLLDRRLPAAERPSLLVEGLAVYLSGGHFKEEPLLERAAALLQPEPGCVQAYQLLDQPAEASVVCGLDSYLPLQDLFDNFYFSQHEIGYLQAGAFVQYLVETYGWETFDAFYRDIQPLKDAKGEDRRSKPSETVDAALQEHFGLGLAQVEQDFIAVMKRQTLTPEWVEDVRLTVAFYDTVRRYQQLLDPSAYFLYAWLPGNQAMREQGIVADYLRRPVDQENLVIESLLVEADTVLRQGEYARVERLLHIINQRLDRLPQFTGRPGR
jgi:hypothetical protein